MIHRRFKLPSASGRRLPHCTARRAAGQRYRRWRIEAASQATVPELNPKTDPIPRAGELRAGPDRPMHAAAARPPYHLPVAAITPRSRANPAPANPACRTASYCPARHYRVGSPAINITSKTIKQVGSPATTTTPRHRSGFISTALPCGLLLHLQLQHSQKKKEENYIPNCKAGIKTALQQHWQALNHKTDHHQRFILHQ